MGNQATFIVGGYGYAVRNSVEPAGVVVTVDGRDEIFIAARRGEPPLIAKHVVISTEIVGDAPKRHHLETHPGLEKDMHRGPLNWCA